MTVTKHISTLRLERSSEENTTISNASASLDGRIESLPGTFRIEDVKQNPSRDLATESGVYEYNESSNELSHFDFNKTPSFSRGHKNIVFSSRQQQSLFDCMFGSVLTKSNQRLFKTSDSDDQNSTDRYEDENSYTIRPARWLINLGFTCGFRFDVSQCSMFGWKSALDTFRPVPDDALIFEFCKEGNLPAVRSLFIKGHASVKDTDSEGRTALHVSHVYVVSVFPSLGLLTVA